MDKDYYEAAFDLIVRVLKRHFGEDEPFIVEHINLAAEEILNELPKS